MYDDGFDQTVATVRAIRELVGEDFAILVDVNNAYLPHTALSVARQLEDYDVWHFEEPLAEHDRDGYAALADAVDLPIAAGEQSYTRWQFRDLMVHDHIDILQPDVITCGGFSEFKKIAALAQAFNKPITVHNTDPTIGTAAHLHLWVSTPNCISPQEYNIEPHALAEHAIMRNPPEVRRGRIATPQGPGLGIELDEDVISRLTTSRGLVEAKEEAARHRLARLGPTRAEVQTSDADRCRTLVAFSSSSSIPKPGALGNMTSPARGTGGLRSK